MGEYFESIIKSNIKSNKKAIKALKMLNKHCTVTLCEHCLFYDNYVCGLKNGNPIIYYEKYKKV